MYNSVVTLTLNPETSKIIYLHNKVPQYIDSVYIIYIFIVFHNRIKSMLTHEPVATPTYTALLLHLALSRATTLAISLSPYISLLHRPEIHVPTNQSLPSHSYPYHWLHLPPLLASQWQIRLQARTLYKSGTISM
jgi:hypothetical protein